MSSSKDCGVLEVTSPSTPYKAWGICCSLKEKDEKRIRDKFKFPSSVKIRVLDGENRVCHSYANEVWFYEVDFVSGLRFPIIPSSEIFSSFCNLNPAQLVPNLWRIVVCCMVIWMFANDRDIIRINEFLHFYRLRKSKDPSY